MPPAEMLRAMALHSPNSSVERITGKTLSNRRPWRLFAGSLFMIKSSHGGCMKSNILHVVFVFFCIVASVAAASAAPELDSQVDAYLKSANFSGTVLLARDGKILVERGFGMADAEHEVKNAAYTRFRLGSLTKQFTAAAIVLLERDGKLAVTDSICKYVTPCPKAWLPVTLH